jgi:hypothetical protein
MPSPHLSTTSLNHISQPEKSKGQLSTYATSASPLQKLEERATAGATFAFNQSVVLNKPPAPAHPDRCTLLAVRRLLTILLLALCALPAFAPLLALTTPQLRESDLPACCRRNGAHHCAMSMAAMSTLARDQYRARPRSFAPPVEPCPFRTTALAPAPPNSGTPGLAAASTLFASLYAHPSGLLQTQCRRRIAQARSRYKRGPPAPSLA